MNAVDLSPILTPIMRGVGIIVMALVGWAVQRVVVRLGVDAKSAQVAQLDDALNKSISAGVMASTEVIKAKGWDHPDVKNAVVSAGASYLIRNWPDLLGKLDVNAEGSAVPKLTDLLTRAFPAAVAPIAQSPATPPLPPPFASGVPRS